MDTLVYIKYFLLNQLLAYVTHTNMECIVLKIATEKFHQNQARAKKSTSNTAYCTSMSKIK